MNEILKNKTPIHDFIEELLRVTELSAAIPMLNKIIECKDELLELLKSDNIPEKVKLTIEDKELGIDPMHIEVLLQDYYYNFHAMVPALFTSVLLENGHLNRNVVCFADTQSLNEVAQEFSHRFYGLYRTMQEILDNMQDRTIINERGASLDDILADIVLEAKKAEEEGLSEEESSYLTAQDVLSALEVLANRLNIPALNPHQVEREGR